MTSRRELYAAGEPFGSCATRAKLGGGYVCGLGGNDSTSTSTTATSDRRAVADNGAISTTGDLNSITIAPQDNRQWIDASTTSWTDASNKSVTNTDSGNTIYNTIDPAATKYAFDLATTSTKDTRDTMMGALQLADHTNGTMADTLGQNSRLFMSGVAGVTDKAITAVTDANSNAMQAVYGTSSNAMQKVYGAYADAFSGAADAMHQAITASNTANANAMDAVKYLTDSTIKAVGSTTYGFLTDAAKQEQANNQLVAQAYQTAAEMSSGQKTVVTVGLVVVGLIALMLPGMKKAA